MAASTSEIFDFYERNTTWSIERLEVLSAEFNLLRRNLQKLIISFRESDDPVALEFAYQYQVLLSEWLTVPITFDIEIVKSIQVLGESSNVEARWGRDIGIFYNSAIKTAKNLIQHENPLCAEIRRLIRGLKGHRENFKIYCHRNASTHFNLLLEKAKDDPLEEDCFLHTYKDYREVLPFDILIKVGPFRSKGWGATPDAILTAPRFSKIIQVVWYGCFDEQGFGYDPVATTLPEVNGTIISTDQNITPLNKQFSWTSKITRKEDETNKATELLDMVDEFQIFREWNKQKNGKNRPATLVQIDSQQGIFYPPLSRVLSFDPAYETNKSIEHRLPGETLLEGMFIITPLLVDLEFHGVQAEHGHFSRIWKARLRQAKQKNYADLEQRLNMAGLNLVTLRSALNNWCKEPTTVIHAPQQRKHFEILIHFLKIEYEVGIPVEKWLKRAWSEICQSRGEAIHNGVVEHDQIEIKLIDILRKQLNEIFGLSNNKSEFILSIPAEEGLKGKVMFNQVSSIEEGFMVPENELRLVRYLGDVEKWRD